MQALDDSPRFAEQLVDVEAAVDRERRAAVAVHEAVGGEEVGDGVDVLAAIFAVRRRLRP